MIVLDTNVISELMRIEPSASVLRWMAAQTTTALFTTTLTQAEVFYGLALLSEGRRRDALIDAARLIFERDMVGRVLPFDADAAMAYAEIGAVRRKVGRPISQIDGQIAAIVASRGARLATRNVRDFEDCGIVLIDPWSAA
jgi:toxin FitB